MALVRSCPTELDTCCPASSQTAVDSHSSIFLTSIKTGRIALWACYSVQVRYFRSVVVIFGGSTSSISLTLRICTNYTENSKYSALYSK